MRLIRLVILLLTAALCLTACSRFGAQATVLNSAPTLSGDIDAIGQTAGNQADSQSTDAAADFQGVWTGSTDQGESIQFEVGYDKQNSSSFLRALSVIVAVDGPCVPGKFMLAFASPEPAIPIVTTADRPNVPVTALGASSAVTDTSAENGRSYTIQGSELIQSLGAFTTLLGHYTMDNEADTAPATILGTILSPNLAVGQLQLYVSGEENRCYFEREISWMASRSPRQDSAQVAEQPE